jgi:hypothetical protein
LSLCLELLALSGGRWQWSRTFHGYNSRDEGRGVEGGGGSSCQHLSRACCHFLWLSRVSKAGSTWPFSAMSGCPGRKFGANWLPFPP